MTQHPLSAIFPALPEDEMSALVEDIAEHGLRQPIVTYQGQVLDGWHRYLACRRAKVPTKEVEYRGKNPAAYVKSCNWHRRHMTASQRAAAVAALNEWGSRGTNQHNRGSIPGMDPTTGGSIPGMDPPKTTKELARQAGVSTATMERAKAVEVGGSDELKQAVHDGEVSVKAAASAVKKPKREQLKAARKAQKPAESPDTVPASKFDALTKKFESLSEKHAELMEELETYQAFANKDEAKEMLKLRKLLEQANRSRDDAMREKAEMQKQVAYYRNELKKLGWKPKTK